ncbi:MAG: ribosome silencing factor, partial [Clostridia bacterium]|nr:ribosome silencing factor [Clostridia bacterium]
GTSSTHVRALAEEVEDRLEQQGVRPQAIEGRATGWILLDYGTVVVHVFTKEARDTYSLERLWCDGEAVDLTAWISQEEEAE